MQEALGTDAWTGRRRRCYVIRMGFCRTSRISEVTAEGAEVTTTRSDSLRFFQTRSDSEVWCVCITRARV